MGPLEIPWEWEAQTEFMGMETGMGMLDRKWEGNANEIERFFHWLQDCNKYSLFGNRGAAFDMRQCSVIWKKSSLVALVIFWRLAR